MKGCVPVSTGLGRSVRSRPKCSICLSQARPQLPPRKRQRTIRYASTSTTAINSSSSVPLPNRKLYQSLKEVETKASAHINQSRLQLALQGLESERPVTRIAILGLDIQENARSIARLLLADPLEDEKSWEKQILQQDGTRGFLIRYGQPQNASIPQRSTLPILHIPSSLLQRLNIELLVSSINGEQGNESSIPAETFLSPAVGVPTAFDGRQVTVNQPVHLSLVVAQGLDELVAGVELLAKAAFDSQADREAVMLIANIPDFGAQMGDRVVVTDVARADKGIRAIRKSISGATTYEHEWLASGLPKLSAWFHSAAPQPDSDTVPTQRVKSLISALLSTTNASLHQAWSAFNESSPATRLDPATHIRTEDAIEDFSRAAHQELQSGLASAWSARNWKKLSWYKLFWRVDDVGLIISDLVTNTWLPKTERATYEMSGRLAQLGINPVMATYEEPTLRHTTAFEPEPAQPTLLDPAPPVLAVASTNPANEIAVPQQSEPVLTTEPRTGRAIIQMKPQPLPVPIASTVSTARNQYLNQQITILTTTAQQLVFRTLSISGLSAGLSALTYASQIAPTLYEAGSIFAIGTVFALYRMQTGWQNATKTLERGLFEEGREIVKKIVGRMRELVELKAAEKLVGDPPAHRMLENAQKAVDAAKSELHALDTHGDIEKRK